MEPLVGVVQDLSLARDLDTVMQIVRDAARDLTGADGAALVLREGDLSYFVEENAVGPLWKGQRYPMSCCISGWVMIHAEAVAIEDIYADPRIPADAYRPTFVKSLAMVPIRTKAPIGAIGNYWATRHLATPDELAVLQALADSTSVAMENVAVYAEMERRVRDRTCEIEAKNRELREKHAALLELERQKEALSAHVVHDLKSPASAIMLAASMGLQGESLSAAERRRWGAILASAQHIQRTALNLLDIAGSHDGHLVPVPVEIDLGALFAEICELFRLQAERREQAIEPCVDVPRGALQADPQLLRRVVQNLVDNALRHSPARGTLHLEAHAGAEGVEVAVSDEGPGIEAHLREHIFDRYVSIREDDDGAGAARGLGLTFCRLAIEAHGGKIWIEDNEPRGSRFCFWLPAAVRAA